MLFKDLAIYLEKLEGTSSRNAMTEILAELFSKTSVSDMDKVVYLLQGRVAPLFVSLEFGMADKMMLKALAIESKQTDKEVLYLFKKVGDLGKVAQELKIRNSKFPSGVLRAGEIRNSKLSVNQVFMILKNMAESGGAGSVDKKINLMAALLSDLDSLSCRFVSRIPVGRMRLGFSDMTVLDSLSWMIDKSKNNRKKIEEAYNVRPDLGFIAKVIKEKGIDGVKFVKPKVFTPILMARAERLSGGKEIFEKIGECAIEPKIDGFRLQVHYDGHNVRLFTRNLEDSTFMYPDVVLGIKKQIKAKEAILEGEAIAYDPDTETFLPFQETVQRKRKYGISQKAKDMPLKLICFELLYKDGENFIAKPYKERREKLENLIIPGDTLILSEKIDAKSAHDIDIEFDKAVSQGLEGIMAKRADGTYQAGARGWNWIKYKRSYSGALKDTVDAVVMGYYVGKGKRTGFGIGAFLIGVYDDKKDNFVTVAKIGTGLTDIEWRTLREESNRIKSNKKPGLYSVDKMLEPDFWVEPKIVVEISADEITRSPIHTAGRKMKASKSGEAFNVDIPGYAMRFPRLERFRTDKKPSDATTLSEIEEMFSAQKNQFKKNK